MEFFVTFLAGIAGVSMGIVAISMLLYTYCDLFDRRIHGFMRLGDATGLLLDIHRGHFTLGFIDYRI